jgi:hypothetical protein
LLWVESVKHGVSITCWKVHEAYIVKMIFGERKVAIEGVAAGISNRVKVGNGGTAMFVR